MLDIFCACWKHFYSHLHGARYLIRSGYGDARDTVLRVSAKLRTQQLVLAARQRQDTIKNK